MKNAGDVTAAGQGRLLRARRHRPCGCAAEKYDEFPSPHGASPAGRDSGAQPGM